MPLRMARGRPRAPPRVRTVYHCLAASGAGAWSTAGTAMSERAALEPGDDQVSQHKETMCNGWDLPSRYRLEVMPTVCATRSPRGAMVARCRVLCTVCTGRERVVMLRVIRGAAGV